jgi:hypothetical protein
VEELCVLVELLKNLVNMLQEENVDFVEQKEM